MKKIILLAIDLKTFNFNFFKDEINPVIFNIITTNFESPENGLDTIKKLYQINIKDLTDLDKFAIFLYNRYYEAKTYPKYEQIILKELSKTNNKNFIKMYTGKTRLSSKDRKKLQKGKVTLIELIKNGL